MKALRHLCLLPPFAMLISVSDVHALQWCGNLPKDSAAYFSCESLNLQERAESERRAEHREWQKRQEKRDQEEAQEDLNRRFKEIVRESEEYRERQKRACAESMKTAEGLRGCPNQ